MKGSAPSTKLPRLLAIGHDASRSGASLHLLRLLEWLKQQQTFEISVFLLLGGPLVADYRAAASELTVLDYRGTLAQRAARRAVRLCSPMYQMERSYKYSHATSSPQLSKALRGSDLVLANTVHSAGILLSDRYNPLRLPQVTQLHELAHSLDEITIGLRPPGLQQLPEFLKAIVNASDVTTVPSHLAYRELLDTTDLGRGAAADASSIHVLPPCGSALRDSVGISDARTHVRELLGIPEDAFLVAGAGQIGQAKGTDLFLQLAILVNANRQGKDRVHFLWFGGWIEGIDSLDKARFLHDVARSPVSEVIHIEAVSDAPEVYFRGADVFAITSREESFGLTAVEAASVGTPVVLFDSIGASDVISAHPELVVPHLDLVTMADRIAQLLDSPQRCRSIGQTVAASARCYSTRVVGPKYQALLLRSLTGTGPTH